jgi:hypothetical protein
MVDLFSEKMGLAEKSTRQYFAAIVEFVDIWERWLADTIPAEVAMELKHSEEPLHPFYKDLAENLERLQRELGR